MIDIKKKLQDEIAQLELEFRVELPKEIGTDEVYEISRNFELIL